ncbi:hypothetical protein RZN05_13970 [Sphingomonas sp. HF-S4]|uniref:Uncharacterized protein n=1 Tax=Sphingomonas agrestis TaxID=3080540 RepID=A0ABU3Y9Y8_9SPHN|nr:hypothetical protein [Sphingomonas sp. HF-S4]MDV3458099.1 hypothetical protein [Sphingomonas sp. HF-S4]
MSLVIACSASASAQDAPAAEAPKPVAEKKVCRSVTPTGSVMAKRICLSREEWKEFDRAYERQNAAFREGQARGNPNQ